jgi:hypothetical protein
MRIGIGLTVVSVLLTQQSSLDPRDLLSNPRPLTNTEIAVILTATQRAMTGKTFRLATFGGRQGPEILMGRAGAPKRIRWAGAILGGTVGGVASDSSAPSRTATTWRLDYITITDYTGRPARHCNGLADQGDLVVEYRLESSSVHWKITARRWGARDFGGLGLRPVFRMLQGAGTLTSGEVKRVGGRLARALVAPWTSPARGEQETMLIGDPIPTLRGDPLPHEAVQSLWIDTRTRLPWRWEVSEQGLFRFGYEFSYSSIDLRLPRGVASPDCIQ